MLADAIRPIAAAHPISLVAAATRAVAAAEAAAPRDWYGMLTEYQRLCHAITADATTSAAARRYADQLAPKPSEVRHYGGARGVQNDHTLSPETKAARIAAFEEWEPRYQAALAAFGYEPRSIDEQDADCDAHADLETELLMRPAPDQRALCEQLRIHLNHHASPLIGESVDDPRYFATLLVSEEWELRTMAATYQGALRLNHLRPEIAFAQPFDAEALISRADAEGINLLVSTCQDTHKPIVAVSIPAELLGQSPLSGAFEHQLDGLIPAEIRALARALRHHDGAAE